ncbi:SDR family oxidoreductase [Aureibacillus halotolerans]|uniref:NAD(P)-dependent dehydrogenase (Short-subunit alcohol dehydrogenase family) n=1 Tax=Aureibacillus halotolerans TaxID=1508390 RepID=A0A4R6UC51_9BACI|nr:SDR family oxidoreductase [Aureibacillus halotolerans]TDQ42579.1 NAD(P)-dependent dehydrogenase (short-subunit alcohol dehydrogenase family) [Aureibacillus halotolerans]
MQEDASERVVLVTGATTGMGLATAEALATTGATVLLHGRNREKGLQAIEQIKKSTGNENLHLFLSDFSSLTSVNEMVTSIKASFSHLDVLVNNAGSVVTKRYDTKDGFEWQWGVNHLSPFLLTYQLFPLLAAAKKARIVNVASGAYKFGQLRWDDLNWKTRKYRTFAAYGQTKLANVMMTYAWARRLERSHGHITVNAVHPGAVATELGINRKTGFGKRVVALLKPFFQTPAQGADTAIYLASSAECEGQSGGYYVKRRRVETSAKANNVENQERLWELSVDAVGVNTKDLFSDFKN